MYLSVGWSQDDMYLSVRWSQDDMYLSGGGVRTTCTCLWMESL